MKRGIYQQMILQKCCLHLMFWHLGVKIWHEESVAVALSLQSGVVKLT